MRSIIVMLLLALIITSVAVFYPDKEGARGPQRLNTSRFESYGYNFNGTGVGTDKGVANLYMQESRKRQEPALINKLEQQAEKVPGVVDIKIVSYLDNLIVGVLTDGNRRVDIRNTAIHNPSNKRRTSPRMYETTDGYHKDIITALRPRLQAESRYNNIFISPSTPMYERISNLHERISRGEQIEEQEFISLLNDIGYTTRGYNLVD